MGPFLWFYINLVTYFKLSQLTVSSLQSLTVVTSNFTFVVSAENCFKF